MTKNSSFLSAIMPNFCPALSYAGCQSQKKGLPRSEQMGQSFSFQRSSTSGVPLRQDEIDAQAADDDYNTHQLPEGDGLVEEQVG